MPLNCTDGLILSVGMCTDPSMNSHVGAVLRMACPMPHAITLSLSSGCLMTMTFVGLMLHLGVNCMFS